MTDLQVRIDQLLRKLEILSQRQEDLGTEIDDLKDELKHLKQFRKEENVSSTEPLKDVLHSIEDPLVEKSPTVKIRRRHLPKPVKKQRRSRFSALQKGGFRNDLEKFIGENLISRIGIIIIVLGAGIGVKYAIDHDLISPVMRIILGYVLGGTLLGIALRLKKNYHNFSAVLLSGAMAIFYFITYAAFSFYDLIPQAATFGVMFLITAFTVFAALRYSSQVIAHIGLVGAYAVPFLLGGDPEKVTFLLSYTLLINIGILLISFRRNWKPLLYSALGLTWIIFMSWHFEYYDSDIHLGVSLIFSSLFFLVFYLAVLANKLIHLQHFDKEDILLLLFNSFLFYSIGYASLVHHDVGQDLLGLFTLAIAVVHIGFSILVYFRKLAKPDLFYFLTALAVVFVTIAIPVQLDGPWVTVLWAGEVAGLFWVGRMQMKPFYEKLSYILVILALMSQVHDWWPQYDGYFVDLTNPGITPIFHLKFLTAILLVCALVFIYYLSRKIKYLPSVNINSSFLNVFGVVVPMAIICVIFFTLYLEVSLYWDQLYFELRNNDLTTFRNLWQFNYTLFFLSILLFINEKKWQSENISLVGVFLLACTLGAYLFAGLPMLAELTESFQGQPSDKLFFNGTLHNVMRYVCLVFVCLALFIGSRITNRDNQLARIRIPFELLLYLVVCWILSSELMHWLDISGTAQSNKLGLSILWGVFSFALIAIGIWKKKAYLRIAAIVLFSATLVKLFFYDITHLDTISKTIVFISLGALLLSISFLYIKFREKLFGG